METSVTNAKLYRLIEQVEESKWLGCVNEDDWKRVLKARWGAVASFWEKIEVEWIPETIKGVENDLIPFAPGLKVFSKKAFDMLCNFSDYGEWLELRGQDGRKFFAFHPLVVEDIFLIQKSNIIGNKNHLSQIIDMTVRDKPDFPEIFRIPESANDFIVSSNVVHLVKEYDLSGFLFKPVSVLQV